MPHFLTIECRCGRTLRARPDQAGSEIHCWNCQAIHVVPMPATGGRLALEFRDAARNILAFENLLRFFAGGLLISSALLIPVAGPVVGLILLAVAGSLYPVLVRQSSLRGAPTPTGPTWRRWPRDLAWGVVIALGLAAPFLLRHVAMDAYGLLLRGGGLAVAALAAACWLAMPLGPLLTSVHDHNGPVPTWRVLAAIQRHPIPVALALLAVPVGLAALEAALIGIFAQQGWFGYLVLDLCPLPGSNRVVVTDTYYNIQDAVSPFSYFLRIYGHGLGLGHTLIGAIPASLPRGTQVRAIPWFPLIGPWHYPAVRVLDSALILAVAGVLLAIQARWLGLIATVDAAASMPSRPVEGEEPAEAPVLSGGMEPRGLPAGP